MQCDISINSISQGNLLLLHLAVLYLEEILQSSCNPRKQTHLFWVGFRWDSTCFFTFILNGAIWKSNRFMYPSSHDYGSVQNSPFGDCFTHLRAPFSTSMIMGGSVYSRRLTHSPYRGEHFSSHWFFFRRILDWPSGAKGVWIDSKSRFGPSPWNQPHLLRGSGYLVSG